MYVAGTKVTQPFRFWWRMIARTPGRTTYTLRDSGLTFELRHATSDPKVFIEIFGLDDYEPPAGVPPLPTDRRPRIVDLGANIGLFGIWIQQHQEAEIIAFEPDPDNLVLLEDCVRANSAGHSWSVVPACAGSWDDSVPFAAGNGWASRIADDADEGVTHVPKHDVFPYLSPTVDLLKIDIEGGEWEILADDRLGKAAIRSMVVEYHPWGAPSGTTPFDWVMSRLTSLGFRVTRVGRSTDEQGVVWAWPDGAGCQAAAEARAEVRSEGPA